MPCTALVCIPQMMALVLAWNICLTEPEAAAVTLGQGVSVLEEQALSDEDPLSCFGKKRIYIWYYSC